MPTKTNILPSQSELLDLLDLIPETGKLYWKQRHVGMFSQCKNPDVARKSWNTRCAGKEAFTATNEHGYRVGTIHNIRFYAHRIIWKMIYGCDPVEVDHIDGDPGNNSILNLRDVSRFENFRNRKKPSSNTSGVIGIHWHRRTQKWQAEIRANNKRIHLGSFVRKVDAAKARKSAEARLGFHENHGRPA